MRGPRCCSGALRRRQQHPLHASWRRVPLPMRQGPHYAEALAQAPSGPASVIPPGWLTIGPPGPRPSASSPTCCAAAMVAAAPGCGAGPCRPGLQAAGCRGQPGPHRQPRAALHQHRLAGPVRLTAATSSLAPARRPLPQRAELPQLVREHWPPSRRKARSLAPLLRITAPFDFSDQHIQPLRYFVEIVSRRHLDAVYQLVPDAPELI